MLEIIFTLDYELYGNGQGSLAELVYEPAKKLTKVFEKWNSRLVVFIEVAELEAIENRASDAHLKHVKNQIREMHRNGHELGLHLHPQWYNGIYECGEWKLDYKEYNLCTLKKDRIEHLINRALCYMQTLAGAADYVPLSYRAGNWLFQPTMPLAEILASIGIKIDSSVFKGGLQHQYHLDYRRATKNGYFWPFSTNVNVPDKNGLLNELPVYTKMVPIWKIMTGKRIGIQRKAPAKNVNAMQRSNRLRDLFRLRYPLKLDFCRMTMRELTMLLDEELRKDKGYKGVLRPIVAIGHTKDLEDIETIESLLSYLKEKDIKISTFKDIYPKLKVQNKHAVLVRT